MKGWLEGNGRGEREGKGREGLVDVKVMQGE